MTADGRTDDDLPAVAAAIRAAAAELRTQREAVRAVQADGDGGILDGAATLLSVAVFVAGEAASIVERAETAP